MTPLGLAFDVAGLAIMLALALLERRRGGGRALLDFSAMLLALVIFPSVGPSLAGPFGGGLLALGAGATALMLATLAGSFWLGRRLKTARDQRRPDEPGKSTGSRRVGAIVGLVEGAIIVGSLSVLVLYLELAQPALQPVRAGSQLVRLAEICEPTLRSWLFGGTGSPPAGGTQDPQPGSGTATAPATTQAAALQPTPNSIQQLAELESIEAIIADPELMEAIKQGNYSVLLNHPKLGELWQDERFRRFIAGVDTAKLVADSKKMQRAADLYEATFTAFRTKEHGKALAAAEELIALDEDFGHILVLRGQILHAQGDLKNAGLAWLAAMNRYATAAEPAYLLADLAADTSPEEAVALYDEALRRNPTFHYALHNRGILQYANGHYLAAVSDLCKSLALRPDDEQLKASVADTMERLEVESQTLLGAGGLRTDGEKWPQLYGWHKAFATAAAGMPAAERAFALVLYMAVIEQGQSDLLPEALAQNERSLALESDAAHHSILEACRSILLLRAEQFGPALAILQRVLVGGHLSIDFTAAALCELATSLARAGDLTSSRQLMGAAVCVQADVPGLSSEQFLDRYRAVDPEGTLPQCDELLDLAPGPVLLSVKGLRGTISYEAESPGAEEGDELAAGDCVTEIDGVEPRWPGEVRQYLAAADTDPPATLAVTRGDRHFEVSIERGLRSIIWNLSRPIQLSAGMLAPR